MNKILRNSLLSLLSVFLIASCNSFQTSPTHLQCEFQENPTGIDVTAPRLSWQLKDTTRGSMQTAYQVIVASEEKNLSAEKADVWNSEKVESDQSHLVAYDGPELQSGMRYYWAVRIWDEDGEPTAFSDPAWWETGIFNVEDWQAKWIGVTEQKPAMSAASIGNWIWSPSSVRADQPVYFRKTFTIENPSDIKEATLRITADKQFTIHLNNRYIGRGGNWQKLYSHNIAPFLDNGENILAVNAMTDNNARAGLLFSIDLHYYNGNKETIISDGTCKVTAQQAQHWKERNHQDKTWEKSRVIAPYGEGTWASNVEFIDPPKAVALRKDINLSNKVKHARAYVTGLGTYGFFINGEKVGKDVLTPGWTHYPDKVQYQTYDVTDMLQQGENTLGSMLGNMWWSSGLGWDGASTYSTGPLKFLAQIEVTYDNDEKEVFVTDESWKSNRTPILYNHIYHGETYDARLEEPGWNASGFDDGVWEPVEILQEKATLVAQQAQTIQITETLTPVNITEPKEDVFVFDFGQNMVGRVKLSINGEKGQKVILRFAELLHDDGTVAQENLRMAKATDTYVLKGDGKEEWAPMFTYHGFRYVQVEGLTDEPDEALLTGEVFHNNVPFNGEFQSSEELLNKIWKNITWGQRGNMMSVPTDCPQRDERLGWMGDAQIFAPTANYNMYMPSFWAKWEKDITDSQEPEGWVYDVNPEIVVEGPSKPGWGDAVVIIPWHNYVFFGDEKIIEDNYEGMKAWVDYMESESDNYIYEWGDTDWGGYGDWVAVEASPTKPIGGIYFNYSSQLLAKMAGILGKPEDSTYYSTLADSIASAYNNKYLDKEKMDYPGGTQTANLLPLITGIADDYKEQIVENIKNNVVKNDTHLTTGFLGTPYLLPVLSDNGYHDLAYAIAVQREYPSWGYMVDNGATSMWELWNSNTEPPEGMNSRNHFAYGSVGEWFFGYLAGIKPIAEHPGFKKSIIAPKPVNDLDWAKANVQTPYGMLRSEWVKDDNTFTLYVSVPPNTTSEIHIPVSTEGSIAEGVNTLLEGGKGKSTEDVEFVEIKNGTAIYEVNSGAYEFIVSN